MSDLAVNRKALANYDVLDTLEAGISLTGPEVKSAKAGHLNLKGSYASLLQGQVLLKKCHISAYKPAADQNFNPERERRLLLHKYEISQIEKKMDTDRLTLIPLSIYVKKGKIKVSLGLCRGKKRHDRRQELKEKAQNLEIKRVLKRFQ